MSSTLLNDSPDRIRLTGWKFRFLCRYLRASAQRRQTVAPLGCYQQHHSAAPWVSRQRWEPDNPELHRNAAFSKSESRFCSRAAPSMFEIVVSLRLVCLKCTDSQSSSDASPFVSVCLWFYHCEWANKTTDILNLFFFFYGCREYIIEQNILLEHVVCKQSRKKYTSTRTFILKTVYTNIWINYRLEYNTIMENYHF